MAHLELGLTQHNRCRAGRRCEGGGRSAWPRLWRDRFGGDAAAKGGRDSDGADPVGEGGGRGVIGVRLTRRA